MATLGRLVSGLAHELNTPLGISLVAATNLSDEIRTIRRLDQERTLTKSSFQEFLDTCDETQNILYSSLKRTADLVSSFKKVSVDQHVDEKRKVNLCEYLDDVLLSLGPQLKRSKVTIETQFPTKIVTTTSPGLWAQLVTNLVLNAIIHGFDDGTSDGNVYVRLHMQKKLIELSVVDNGVGIPAEKLRHIFEPFYTTRRAKGGTGLGLHIVYNLVTQKLLGHITVTSRHKSQYGEHSGTTFVIQVPFAL